VWVQARGEYSQVGTLDALRAMSAIAALRDTVCHGGHARIWCRLTVFGGDQTSPERVHAAELVGEQLR